MAARERLAKVMAAAGVASRRKSETLIFSGHVRVNGQTITHPGVRVDPDNDRIEVKGRRLTTNKPKQHLVLYKPRGVVSSCRDPRGRQTVVDLIPERGRLFPVGRLDRDSEGLLVMTNDGDLALLMTHPRYEMPKVYVVSVRGRMSADDVQKLAQGVELDDGPTKPTEVEILVSESARTVLAIVLREGRKRQVRRMIEAVGYQVSRLKRVAIGPLELGDLNPGQWRHMTDRELVSLRKWQKDKAKSHRTARRMRRS